MSALFEEQYGCSSLLNELDYWLVYFNWYLNWLTNLSKSFRSISQLTSEGVGTKDGPFFSNDFCGLLKNTADKLIAFWSGKLFFMSVILCFQWCFYFFLFLVFFCWFILSESFSYLILSLINFRLCFFLMGLSMLFNSFLIVGKDLLYCSFVLVITEIFLMVFFYFVELWIFLLTAVIAFSIILNEVVVSWF